MAGLRGARWALYAALFALTAAVGRLTASDDVAPVWPAAGVATLWLLGTRGRARDTAALAAVAIGIAAPLLTGASPAVSVVLACSTVVAALAATALATHLWRGRPCLTTLEDGARLLAVAVTGGTAAGLAVAVVAPLLPARADLPLAVLVGVRDMLGCLLVLVVALAVRSWGRRRGARPRWWQLAGDSLATVVVYLLVFVAGNGLSVSYPALPLTLVIALWCGVLRTAVHTSVAAVLAATLTQLGYGPFQHGSPMAQALTSQGFVAVISVAGLGLALVRAEQARATVEATAALNRLHAIADAAPVANLTVRVQGESAVIVRANPAAALLLQTPVAELTGRAWSAFVDPVDQARVHAELTSLTTDEASGRTAFEVLHRLPSGDVRWTEVSAADARAVDDDGDGATYVTVQMLDVTARREAEGRLAHLALHDELTGLPNRLLLMDRLDQALAESRRTGRGVAVVFFDLDLFKRVNDTLGHAAGDDLLVAVANRLADAARESDTVARLGGDEFVACCPGVATEDEGRALAERLLRLAGRPVDLQGHEVRVGLSAGVTVSRPESTAAELLRESDDALYAAKHAGRGRVESYSDRVAAHVQRHVEIGEGLHRALDRDELVLHYQPIVDLRTGQVRALEALVRWDHPTRGLLLPAEWLDVAESSDVMVPLGRWVLREACAEAVRQAHLGRPVSMHVNVAARELRDPGMAAAARGVLTETGLDPARLVLELTETRLLEVHQSLLSDLEDLRGLGVRIAADDFGTGYSTLRQLVDLPIDMVKIDRGFVSAVAAEPRATAVVHGIVGMAQSIGMTLVAEGVETPDQARVLEEAGCYLGQGFLWHRPAPADELRAA